MPGSHGLRRDGADARFDDPYGDVFLVIDGWATVRQEFDGLEEAITALAAQGLAVGVHVMLAASRWVEIRPALKDLVGTRIELRLGDPADSEMDRRRARLLGDSPPGRGITRDGLDMVIALPRLDGRSSSVGLDDALRMSAELLRARHPAGECAARRTPADDGDPRSGGRRRLRAARRRRS